MMRVLHVIGSPAPGGIEKQVLELSCQQRRSGVIVPAIAFCREQGEWRKYFLDSGLAVYDFYLTKLLTKGSLSAVLRILRRFSIVHIHTCAPLVIWLAWLVGCKIVVTVHSLRIRQELSWKRWGKDLAWQLSFIAIDYLSFNSHYTQQFIEKHYYCGQLARGVVYNGISIGDKPLPVEFSLPQGKWIIGTCGRLVAQKRISWLIEALANLKEYPWLLLIIGEGPEEKRLKQVAAHYYLQEQVHFLGWRFPVASWQNLFDVGVFPSQRETFGLAVLEVMSLGKPVIVAKGCGGSEEFVGREFPENMVSDSQQLAERIGFYLRDPHAMVADGEKAREVARNYSSVRAHQEFYQIYQDIQKSTKFRYSSRH